ncbi:MAG TPA: hypothetical protein VKZ42_03180, partial [Flavobacteriaceae bacterium]|nr:hypothetical protein [Flavobacteriaceae bacterium]
MYKKILFLAACLSFTTVSFAQKAKVNEAIREMEKAQTAASKSDAAKEAEAYTKAKAAIDLAMTDESTKDKAKTLYTKAGIYLGMQNNSQLNADNPYVEGLAALQKAIELDKKYEKEPQTASMLANSAFYLYNDGIQTYNNNKFAEAY